MTEAVQLVVDYLFASRKQHRIQLVIHGARIRRLTAVFVVVHRQPSLARSLQ